MPAAGPQLEDQLLSRPYGAAAMLILGSLLAVVSGMFYVTAAIVQKREGMQVLPAHKGFRLLAALVRRPAWLLSVVISVVAWVAEAVSLALAPVATVTTLRNAGRGFLVVGGRRWLNESFSRWEIAGVALGGAGGALTAIAGVHSTVSRRTLSNFDQLATGVGCCLAAMGVVWAGSSLGQRAVEKSPEGRWHASGVLFGVAVGLLFAGTGVFTKEIADRVALHGAAAFELVVVSPAPWMLLLMGIWAQNLLQEGFRRANAAAVSSASAATASLGMICAGFTLYAERPLGGAFRLLAAGAVISLLGTSMLFDFRPTSADTPSEMADIVSEISERV